MMIEEMYDYINKTYTQKELYVKNIQEIKSDLEK